MSAFRYHLCDLCRWYSWAYVNESWHGHVCLAPDYQHEMPRKKVAEAGEDPAKACRHFTEKEEGVES